MDVMSFSQTGAFSAGRFEIVRFENKGMVADGPFQSQNDEINRKYCRSYAQNCIILDKIGDKFGNLDGSGVARDGDETCERNDQDRVEDHEPVLFRKDSAGFDEASGEHLSYPDVFVLMAGMDCLNDREDVEQ